MNAASPAGRGSRRLRGRVPSETSGLAGPLTARELVDRLEIRHELELADEELAA
jgi:hypothetical protein